MFVYKTRIKLHETDAAGLLFFAHQFTIVHDAYEALLEEFGCSFQTMLRERDYFLPIVHAGSDYKAPLFVGDHIAIAIRISDIGTTSFTFEYTINKEDGTLVGLAKTVHVTINKKSGTKVPLPDELRSKLEAYQNKN